MKHLLGHLGFIFGLVITILFVATALKVTFLARRPIGAEKDLLWEKIELLLLDWPKRPEWMLMKLW